MPLLDPTTSNVADGEVVPIPTFPLSEMRNRSTAVVVPFCVVKNVILVPWAVADQSSAATNIMDAEELELMPAPSSPRPPKKRSLSLVNAGEGEDAVPLELLPIKTGFVLEVDE